MVGLRLLQGRFRPVTMSQLRCLCMYHVIDEDVPSRVRKHACGMRNFVSEPVMTKVRSAVWLQRSAGPEARVYSTVGPPCTCDKCLSWN